MSRKLIADAKIRHDDVWLKSGDEIFGASEQDGADLVAMGMAHWQETIAEAVVQRVKRTYRRRDMTSQ